MKINLLVGFALGASLVNFTVAIRDGRLPDWRPAINAACMETTTFKCV